MKIAQIVILWGTKLNIVYSGTFKIHYKNFSSKLCLRSSVYKKM